MHLDRLAICLFVFSFGSPSANLLAADPLASFGLPHINQTVVNATLVLFSNVTDKNACASSCLGLPQQPRCIGFALIPVTAGFDCFTLGWSQTYTVIKNITGASYYSRLIDRDDRPVVPALTFALETPTSGIILDSSSLFARYHALNRIYLSQFPVDDMLYWFRIRAGNPNPPGQSYGWDNAGFEGGYGLKGSVAGAFLMGAGGHVRWNNDSLLWDTLKAVVDGVANAQQIDGFAMAFNEEDTHCRENPDYVTSWMTHGLLEAAGAGISQALSILRRHYDYFDYAQDELAQFLPPLGGPNVTGLPWPDGEPPDPYGPPFCRRDLQTNQGMVHNTRMALSPVGTMRDAAVVEDIYAEAWWLEALAERDEEAIWMRHYYPHNYEITAWEAFLDLGVITGNPKYISAVDGAWELLRANWLHVGGSVAINEAQLYPPGSYYLEPPNPDWQHPTPLPTGELCGSSFWIKLNQRLLRLRPSGEVYATEIERSLLNIILAAISSDGFGIRYFARLHQHKDSASNVSTCCEGQGTRELGALPEFIFSTSLQGVYIHLYQAAIFTIQWASSLLTINLQTNWPYNENVIIFINSTNDLDPPGKQLSIFLRMPSWLGIPQVNISITNSSGDLTFLSGEKGSYVEMILQPRELPVIVSFSLPMEFRSTLYTGYDQIGNSSRYAIELGPILLAATGTLTPIGKDAAIILPDSLNPARPETWLEPISGNMSTLRYNVIGAPGIIYMPYFDIQDESFDVFPIIGEGYDKDSISDDDNSNNNTTKNEDSFNSNKDSNLLTLSPTTDIDDSFIYSSQQVRLTIQQCVLTALQAYVVPPIARAGRLCNVTAEIQDMPVGCLDLQTFTSSLILPGGISPPSKKEANISRRDDGLLILSWSSVLAKAAFSNAPASFSVSAPSVTTPITDAAFTVSFLPQLETPPLQTKYAPVPSPPDTGTIVAAMMICSIWRGRNSWLPLLPFRDREPALSFYDDGDPTVVDWELSWALDAGVKLFIPVWFRQKGNAGQNPVLPTLSHWLHDGFFNARYASLSKFAIMWDNYNSCCDGLGGENATLDLIENIVPFWINNYWTRPEAYIVNGSPLVVIYDPDLFIQSLGGPAATAKAFAVIEDLVHSFGFTGVFWAGQWCYGNTSDSHTDWSIAGFKTTVSYHWPSFTDLASNLPGGRFPNPTAMGALEPECSERQDAGALPNIPTITSGWNDLPWNPAPGNSNRLWRLDTNDYENTVSNLIKLLANRRANGATGLHATHLAIDNMNEWAEGHFVGPHRQYGFSRYDAIRSVLAPSAMMNQWLLPEDVGLPWDKFTSCFNEFNVTPCLEKGE
jgi:hypothetical protein